MGLFGAIEISASGLTAQRLRMDLTANNIANINTTRTGELTPAGNQIPYSRQVAVFVPRPPETPFSKVLGETMGLGKVGNGYGNGNGVQVASVYNDVTEPFRLEYNPASPDAATVVEEGLPVGYVRQPNVNIVTEMVDMMTASRAYEANVTALNVSKSMATKALEIGKG
ncbi:flagellar basal body rod protein FlgC [Desulfosporosinus sp. BICA1-9]|uniref:flagellar basal body rod protein FlgC n=1 Tax=Desulfosporosinus sp. BICA1-9 TaxID=1531958 RepID=UPI00054C432E|nr:flagellar basal body rod protein FlgC [Desulfosporosinus sp. BICA1-9]KJS47745.1 MAG: flagellar basal body rod protein FlgC [Peptococcaceae bacterium BRH_c23]KJS90031.1 MAG: flagellar basal body rod protein FlgC [Desulfosporosinus sp. BICA1-9]HBW36439.1 flagellar basal body rod protein FlgC [Desulfosporosinus sp.]